MWRKCVSVWAIISLGFAGFFFPIRDVYAITIPTRQISPGVFAIAPSTGATVLSIVATAIGRVNPWIGAATLGLEIAKFIIQTQDGQIAVTSAGRAILEQAANPIHSATPSSYNQQYCRTDAAFCSSSSLDAAATVWAAAQTGPCANAPHTVTGGDGVYFQSYNFACSGFGVSNNFQMYTKCWDSSTWQSTSTAAAFNTKIASCSTPPAQPATGGTQSWSPRAIAMPDGTTQWGWEAPSDPGVSNAAGISPTDHFNYPSTNGVSPQVTLTPNADGGVTVQTWSPTFNTATPPQQTGWTVQTTTINNAGNVTNSSLVTINNAGIVPPTSTAPTTTAAVPPPTGTAANPTPAQPIVCGSLNCESTQQGIHTDTTGIHTDTTAILDEVQANGAPTLPDQSTALQTSKDQDKAKADLAIGDIQTEGIAAVAHDNPGIWGNWLWTPPVGTCSAPTASLSRGVTVSFNYCPMVDNIRTALGWLFAIFASWHIWNVMMRRDD